MRNTNVNINRVNLITTAFILITSLRIQTNEIQANKKAFLCVLPALLPMTRLEPQKYFPTVVVEDVYLHPCCDGASGIRGATSTRRACGGKNCDGRVKGTLCLVRVCTRLEGRERSLSPSAELRPAGRHGSDLLPAHHTHPTKAPQCASDAARNSLAALFLGPLCSSAELHRV